MINSIISRKQNFLQSNINYINSVKQISANQNNPKQINVANAYKSWSWGDVPCDRNSELLYAIKVAKFNEKLGGKKTTKTTKKTKSVSQKVENFYEVDENSAIDTAGLELPAFANAFKYTRFKSIMRKIIGKNFKNFSKKQLLLLPSIIMRMQKLDSNELSSTINNISKMQVRGDVALNKLDKSILAFISYGGGYDVNHLDLIKNVAIDADVDLINDASRLSIDLILKDYNAKNSSVFKDAINFINHETIAVNNDTYVKPVSSSYLYPIVDEKVDLPCSDELNSLSSRF